MFLQLDVFTSSVSLRTSSTLAFVDQTNVRLEITEFIELQGSIFLLLLILLFDCSSSWITAWHDEMIPKTKRNLGCDSQAHQRCLLFPLFTLSHRNIVIQSSYQ